MVCLAAAVVGLTAACGASDDGSSSVSSVVGDAQVQQGAKLVASEGCASCHTTNGAKASGPTFKGLAGSQVTLSDGSTVTADAAYLAESVTSPDAKVVKGFSKGIMSAVMANRKKLSTEEVAALVAYLQALH